MKKIILIIIIAAGISGQIFAGFIANPATLINPSFLIQFELVNEATYPVLENWMIETVSPETRLELEDWMMTRVNDSFTSNEEERITTENWMLNTFKLVEEKEIEVEKWMFVFDR